MMLNFTIPSLNRCLALLKSVPNISIQRALQYEVIGQYKLKGVVLDYGGGEKVLYRKLLLVDEYFSVNIDPAIKPTWLIIPGEKIPCNDGKIDTVISLNTLEHVFNASSVISELHRVMRSGGEILLSTPFLYPVHGHPDDYFRPTPSWYIRVLEDAGFGSIKVIPLSWGPFTVGAICSRLPGPFRKIRMKVAIILDYLYFLMRFHNSTSLNVEKCYSPSAVAFFVRALKL